MFSLIWSNLFRRKARAVLTLFSLLVAFLLFGLLRAVASAFNAGVDFAGVDRLTVSPKYSIVDLLPVSHLSRIAAVDGVDSVVHQTWFGGTYQRPTNFFPKFPVQPREWFAMYDEYVIDPELLDAFERNRIGAVAPADLAREHGWRAGDRIPIEGDIWLLNGTERRWEFELVGTYESVNEGESFLPFVFQYDYFDEARIEGAQGGVGWFTVRVEDPENAAEVAAAIDAMFENGVDPTRSATEEEFTRQFAAQVGDIGLIMNGILFAVFFTILLLTFNTMVQTYRERIPELAVLKTVGFTDAGVFGLMLAESVLLCAFGGALGIVLASAIAGPVGSATESFLAAVGVTPPILLAGAVVAVAAGAAVALAPPFGARRAVSASLWTLGGLSGVGLASAFGSGLRPAVEGFLGAFGVTPGIMLAGMGIAVALGAAVGLAPALGARRLQIVDALRR